MIIPERDKGRWRIQSPEPEHFYPASGHQERIVQDDSSSSHDHDHDKMNFPEWF